MSNKGEVLVSVFARKCKYLQMDDCFSSKHKMKIVQQYLSKVGIWEKDLDALFPDNDINWESEENCKYLDFDYEVNVELELSSPYESMRLNNPTYPIDEKIDRWLENNKKVDKELNYNQVIWFNKNAEDNSTFMSCWIDDKK